MGFYKYTVNSYIDCQNRDWTIYKDLDGFGEWHDPVYRRTGQSDGVKAIKAIKGNGRFQSFYDCESNMWVYGDDARRRRGKYRVKDKKKDMIDLGIIRENDVYEWFCELVEKQSLTKTVLKNQESGLEKIFVQGGRWCMTTKDYEKKLKKKFKKKLGNRYNVLFLSLTIDREKVFNSMPLNTNLKPIAWAVMNIGQWTSEFMQRLKAYHRKFNRNAKKTGARPIRAYFVGWVLEEQEESGWPHIHMIWVTNYIGRIQDIAKLWPWGGDDGQGVDYVDRRKLERKRKEKGLKVSRTNVVNYVINYIGKNRKNNKVNGAIGKTMAWVAFFGVRLFNLSHKYAEIIVRQSSHIWEFVRTYMGNDVLEDDELIVKEGVT